MSEKLRAHLLLLAVVAVWGSTFVLVKNALNDISPLLFNLIRMALATLCLRRRLSQTLSPVNARGAGRRGSCRLLPGGGLSVPDGGPRPDYSVQIGIPHRIDGHHRSSALGNSGASRSRLVASRLERLSRGAGRAGGNHADDRARSVFARSSGEW